MTVLTAKLIMRGNDGSGAPVVTITIDAPSAIAVSARDAAPSRRMSLVTYGGYARRGRCAVGPVGDRERVGRQSVGASTAAVLAWVPREAGRVARQQTIE